VTAPVKKGFGTILIERGLSHDLAGEAKIQFLPDGVQARLRTVVGNPNKSAASE
jgi:two-component sensor histidine kinase